MNQASREFKNYANNLRRTALGIKFTKQLFTNPSSLTPKTIAAVFKTLGLDIPQELVITAEVAQIITAGQAITTAVQSGKTLQDVQAATNMTAASIRTLTAIAGNNKWIDSDTVGVVSVGVDVAMIYASAGTDVKSWISLSLNLANASFQKQGLADYRAAVQANEIYASRLSGQAKILGDTFLDFQNKNISIYGVIAKMAVDAPDLWPQVIKPGSPITNLFPELYMLPVTQASVSGYGVAEISGHWPWPSGEKYIIARWDSNKTINFQTLGKTFNKETSAEYFFEMLIRPWVTCYAIANEEIVKRGNMSMENIAALSYMINPSGEISDRDDYVKFLIGSCLTPYDFGDDILRNISGEFVANAYKGQDTRFQEQAISYRQSGQNQTFNRFTKDQEIMRQKLEMVKQNDDIVDLVQYPFIYQKLKSYMDFQQVSFERDPSYGGRLNQKFQTTDVRAWRKLHNYIAVLNMIDQFRTDSYLSQTRFAQQLLPFMPSVDSFTKKVEDINYLSTMRSVNRVALSNIASFIGVAPDKLVKLNKTEPGAAIYTIK